MELSQILALLVQRYGVELLQERNRTVGLLLDQDHQRQAWLMEIAFDLGVVASLRKNPGWFNQRRALQRLQTHYGLAPAAATQIVLAVNLALGRPSKKRTKIRLRWLLLVLAAPILAALGWLAYRQGGEQAEQWQTRALQEAKAAIGHSQREIKQITEAAESTRQKLQTELDDAKREAQARRLQEEALAREAAEEVRRREEAKRPVMLALKGGCFRMGSLGDEPNRYDDEQQHQVCVKPFKLGQYEVTQAQWQAVTGNNPSGFSSCGDCPVEHVSFNDVQAFIAKLNQQTGQHYRLPTEAEWEYACRAGKTQTYCGSDDVDAVAWYRINSGNQPHPVGKKQKNDFGLYDMTGNIEEWVQDCWHDSYSGAPSDGSAWENDCTEGHRVYRGGSWSHDARSARSTDREGVYPAFTHYVLGFRVAQD